MTASKDYRKTFSVGLQFNTSCSLFMLTSPELPGLFLVGKDPQKLWDDVPAVVKAMYRVAYNMNVEVSMDQPTVDAGDECAFMPLPAVGLARVEPLHA